jgi:peptidoglycan/LPS O-acetylase OafA/YrhL
VSSEAMISSGHKLYKLEALRGLAAFYVVLHHALPHKYLVGGFNAYNFFRFGQEAVILFFLLSGFVIKYSHSFSKDKSFRQYFLKRFLRIYVPLICVFGVSYLILSLAAGSLIDPNLGQLFGNLFMLQDWAKVKPHVIVDPYLANNCHSKINRKSTQNCVCRMCTGNHLLPDVSNFSTTYCYVLFDLVDWCGVGRPIFAKRQNSPVRS